MLPTLEEVVFLESKVQSEPEFSTFDYPSEEASCCGFFTSNAATTINIPQCF